MFSYLIDENLPSTLPFWNKIKFIHVSNLTGVNSDTEVWRYAFINELVIVTKDADFYFRYLSSSFTPKVIWIRNRKH